LASAGIDLNGLSLKFSYFFLTFYFIYCTLRALKGEMPVRRIVIRTAALHMSDLVVSTLVRTSGAIYAIVPAPGKFLTT